MEDMATATEQLAIRQHARLQWRVMCSKAKGDKHDPPRPRLEAVRTKQQDPKQMNVRLRSNQDVLVRKTATARYQSWYSPYASSSLVRPHHLWAPAFASSSPIPSPTLMSDMLRDCQRETHLDTHRIHFQLLLLLCTIHCCPYLVFASGFCSARQNALLGFVWKCVDPLAMYALAPSPFLVLDILPNFLDHVLFESPSQLIRVASPCLSLLRFQLGDYIPNRGQCRNSVSMLAHAT